MCFLFINKVLKNAPGVPADKCLYASKIERPELSYCQMDLREVIDDCRISPLKLIIR